MKFRLSPRLALIIIATLFLLPLVIAWLIHQGMIEFRHGSTINLGQLVQPPVPVIWNSNGAESLEGHWVVLHVVPDPCPTSCVEAVTGLRQVHKAAGRQQSRIQIALLLDSNQLEISETLNDIYPLFKLIDDPGGEFRNIFGQIADSMPGPSGYTGSSYLIDPLGNIMMYYAAGFDPNHLKKDLERLLTWSKLDEQS